MEPHTEPRAAPQPVPVLSKSETKRENLSLKKPLLKTPEDS